MRMNTFEYETALTALREELDGANRRLAACINQIEEEQNRLTATEQRNAELTKLLHSASVDYARCLKAGYDRITSLGGDCDSVEKMLTDNPNYAKYITVLTDHKKSGAGE